MTSHQSDRIIAKSPSIAIPLQHRRTNSNIQGTESLASRRSITMLATSHRSAKQIKRLQPGHSPLAGGKSFESRVLIDIDSPNFITMEQKQHDEIVNSFRNYYMKDLMQGKRKSSSTSANSASISGVDDEDAVFDFGNVTERLSIHNDPHLNTVGGDITRELYRIGSKNQRGVYKNKSYDDLSLVQSHRRGSTASALNVPGGFRREYIVSKIRKDVGAATDGQTSSDSKTLNGLSMYKVPFLTRNFLEFLYVDGHFAGESFDEDFDIVTPYTESTDEMTPLLTGDVEGQQIHLKVKTSTFKAFLLLIKSFVGTGVLFLPNAFNQGGLLFSTLMLLFFSVYSFWCYYALIRSKVATGVSSFGDIGLILFGPWMKFVILLSLVLTQIGFAGAYIVFTAKNLIVFIENVFSWREIRIEYMLLLQLAIFIPLSFVRTISKLSLSSLLANCFVITGLLIVIYHTAKHFIYDLGMKPEEGVIFLFNPNKWSLFIGTAIFAFEGVGLIIPVQDSMRHPEKFPMVLAMVILTTAALFVTVGVLGYLAYGKYIQNVILFNLPQQALSVNLIQLFYSIAILLTTPLQLFPVIAIIENKVFPQFIKIYDKPHDRSTYNLIPNTGRLNWKVKWTKNLVRSIIVTFVILIAYFGVDNLDLFVSLVGCFACIPLVYMYPPMLHLRSCSIPSHENQQSFASLAAVCFDYVLIIFGGVSTIYTTYNCLTN